MKISRVKISELKEYAGNVRLHTKRNLDALKASLTQFGQYKPLVVQKSTMQVLAGNGTLQAANALGTDELDCYIIDIDDDKAMALSIADNRVGELSEWDEKLLMDTLQTLGDDLLEVSGFSSEELTKMLDFKSDNVFDNVNKKPKANKAKDNAFPSPVANETPEPHNNTAEDAESVENAAKIANVGDQVSFVLMGYPFVLSDKEEITELKLQMELLMDSDASVKNRVVKNVFAAVVDTLRKEFME